MTHRTGPTYDDIAQRLARIAGHAASLKRLWGEGRDGDEMLTQIAAVRVALDPAGRAILEHQIEHDVTEAVEQGHPDQAIKDLMQALDRFILSTQLLATLYPDGRATLTAAIWVSISS